MRPSSGNISADESAEKGGRLTLYIGCVYMPIDSTSVAELDTCYERLEEDVLSFREKQKVVLLGDFNARVGKMAYDAK